MKGDHRKLAETIEKSLKSLGFAFIKHGGGTVTEFEVRSPCQLLITVHDLKRLTLGLLFIPHVKVESLIDVRPIIGASNDTGSLRRAYSDLAKALSNDVPEKKWKGMEKADG